MRIFPKDWWCKQFMIRWIRKNLKMNLTKRGVDKLHERVEQLGFHWTIILGMLPYRAVTKDNRGYNTFPPETWDLVLNQILTERPWLH